MVRIVKNKAQKLEVDDAGQALLKIMERGGQFRVGGENSSYVHQGF
jgi:hypothetical protein